MKINALPAPLEGRGGFYAIVFLCRQTVIILPYHIHDAAIYSKWFSSVVVPVAFAAIADGLNYCCLSSGVHAGVVDLVVALILASDIVPVFLQTFSLSFYSFRIGVSLKKGELRQHVLCVCAEKEAPGSLCMNAKKTNITVLPCPVLFSSFLFPSLVGGVCVHDARPLP